MNIGFFGNEIVNEQISERVEGHGPGLQCKK